MSITDSDSLGQFQRFQSALGAYIMNTASTESLFLTMMQLALRDTTDAPAAIWLQFSSTRARLEMVVNVYRSKFGQSAKTETVTEFARRFKGLTRQRNFYCHSVYFPESKEPAFVIGYDVSDGEQVIQERIKKIDKATCNEVSHACKELAQLSAEMWDFIRSEQTHLLKIGVISMPFAKRPLSLGGA
jgi:hypothetical protein